MNATVRDNILFGHVGEDIDEDGTNERSSVARWPTIWSCWPMVT